MKKVNVDHLTKIEGHATLHVKIKNGVVEDCRLTSIEGSRYFEGMLKGRRWDEAFEITSRICGICSTGHIVTSIQAMEDALGVKPSPQTLMLRELLTIAERIRSHATHLYFLALPDHLGYESAIAMIPKYKKQVVSALTLMRLGNDMMVLLGGREMHAVQAAVGGFRKFPSQDAIDDVRKRLEKAKADAVATAKLFAKLPVPDFESPCDWLSLYKKGEIGMHYGDLKGSDHTFKRKDFAKWLKETHESDSTANFVVKKGKAYFTNALARLNNCHKFLSPDAKKILKASKVKLPSKNTFLDNFAQAIELVHYVDESIRLCKKLKPKKEKIKDFKIKAGHGIGVIEVPRGLCWHEYKINKNGEITFGNVMTPTCQNLRAMNEDIKAYLPQILKYSESRIQLEIEKLIRAYDPCFSCSTHFLKIKWDKT